MSPETYEFLKLRWNYNKAIIENKMVGCGDSKIENDLINMIVISEKVEAKDDFTYSEKMRKIMS